MHAEADVDDEEAVFLEKLDQAAIHRGRGRRAIDVEQQGFLLGRQGGEGGKRQLRRRQRLAQQGFDRGQQPLDGGAGEEVGVIVGAEVDLVAGGDRGQAEVEAGGAQLELGQTGGKLVIFLASRRGVTRWRSSHAEKSSRTPAWVRRTNVWLLHLLSDSRRGPAAVAVSATVGLPPLALVSASAGASTMRCSAFGLTCLAGRVARFTVVAGGVTALLT